MNERIKELAEQAEVWNVDGDKCEVDLQRFAELIVRECVEVVKWTPSMFPNDTTIKNIKEHFGVKE